MSDRGLIPSADERPFHRPVKLKDGDSTGFNHSARARPGSRDGNSLSGRVGDPPFQGRIQLVWNEPPGTQVTLRIARAEELERSGVNTLGRSILQLVSLAFQDS